MEIPHRPGGMLGPEPSLLRVLVARAPRRPSERVGALLHGIGTAWCGCDLAGYLYPIENFKITKREKQHQNETRENEEIWLHEWMNG